MCCHFHLEVNFTAVLRTEKKKVTLFVVTVYFIYANFKTFIKKNLHKTNMECSLTITVHTLVHHNINLQDVLSVTKLIIHFHRKCYFKTDGIV